MNLLKPKIMEALAEMDTTGGGSAGAGASAIGGYDQGSVKNRDVLKFYFKYKLWEFIDPKIKKAYDRGMNALWDKIDIVKGAAQQSLIASLGNVPGGGTLAAVATKIIDVVYSVAKNGVNRALSNLRVKIQNKIIDAILDKIMGGMSAGKMISKKSAEDAGKSASKAQKTKGISLFKKKAKGSRGKAKSAGKGILAFAKKLGAAQLAEDKEIAQAEVEAAK
jgi:hypothetical protein